MSMMMRTMTGVANLGGIGREAVVRFEPQSGEALVKTVPDKLVTWDRPNVSNAVRRRRFEMNIGMGGQMRGGMTMFGINGRAFDMSRIDERIRLGDTEIWEGSGRSEERRVGKVCVSQGRSRWWSSH